MINVSSYYYCIKKTGKAGDFFFFFTYSKSASSFPITSKMETLIAVSPTFEAEDQNK